VANRESRQDKLDPGSHTRVLNRLVLRFCGSPLDGSDVPA
jgi:hypothetical protein